MHLIKLCVGIETLEELAAWQAHRLDVMKRAGVTPELVHRTRQTPRQGDAVLKSGSLYWVIKGFIRGRQRILALREETGTEGKPLCGIVLDRTLIATRPQPRRPFQGWRYLKPEEAPADLGAVADLASSDIPPAMRAELAELALL
ncbi:MAG: DUF1489 domain-containing protein [Rhodomicrobium sp.]|nr:DUF1489 domain-containing protein [Rhodomicrobium sp.]